MGRMSKVIKLCMIMFLLRSVDCTVDLNMAEIKYLADHLQPEECRRLVAALHFSSYNKPNSLDSAEAKISEDISCLSLLLHWNSAKGEGLGQTHEQLFERLAQIGRYDLSEWLGKTVFHELGQDFKKSLDNPFDELINEITESEFSTTTQQSLSTVEDDWLPFDTICWAIILLLIVIAIVVILQCILNRSNKQRKRNKNRMSGIDNYIQYQPVLLEPES